MEQHNIDNFFKSKLEHREVKFNESAWAAAEQMIIAQERKSFWRRFGWLLLLLPFLAGVGYLFISESTQSTNPALPDTIISTSNSSDKPDYNSTKLTIDRETERNKTENEERIIPATIKPQDIVVSKEEGDKTSKSSLQDIKNTTTNNIKAAGEASPEAPTFNSKGGTPNNNTDTKKAKPRLPQANVFPADADLHFDETDKDDDTDLITRSFESDTKKEVDESSLSFAEKNNIAALDLSDLNFQFEASTPKANKEQVMKYKSKKFVWGAMTSVAMTPNFNGKAIDFSGANAGLTFGYALNKRISLNADLLYEFHRRNISFPNGNNTLAASYNNYSFGLENRNLEVTLKQSHLLTMPVYLQVHFRKHQVEAGVQMAYNIGLKGDLKEGITPIQSNNIEADTRENVQKNTWIDVEGTDPLDFNFMMGYRFKLTDNLNIGLRVLVIPNGNKSNDRELLGASAYDPINDPFIRVATNTYSLSTKSDKTSIPLFNNNTYNFQLNVQYLLNKKPSYSYKPLLAL